MTSADYQVSHICEFSSVAENAKARVGKQTDENGTGSGNAYVCTINTYPARDINEGITVGGGGEKGRRDDQL